MNPSEIPLGARAAAEKIHEIDLLFGDRTEVEDTAKIVHVYAVAYAQQQVEEKTMELQKQLADSKKNERTIGLTANHEWLIDWRWKDLEKELTTLREVAKELFQYTQCPCTDHDCDTCKAALTHYAAITGGK